MHLELERRVLHMCITIVIHMAFVTRVFSRNSGTASMVSRGHAHAKDVLGPQLAAPAHKVASLLPNELPRFFIRQFAARALDCLL